MRLPLQLEWMEDGMKLAILTAYVQGLELLAVASEKEGWELDFTAIVRGWSGGCIIRSQILLFLEGVLVGGSNVLELFQSDLSAVWINNYRKGLQKTVELAHDAAIPVLALSSALSWVDRCKSSGDAMRLIQAQRDYFGNHGFHREDCNGVFHCDWR